MIGRLLYRLMLFLSDVPKSFLIALAVLLVIAPFVGMVIALVYEDWDNDPDRGAIAISNGQFNESFSVPEYLNQGWESHDSLWFYNTTQGSALLPYDFFLALEQPDSRPSVDPETQSTQITCERQRKTAAWLLCDENVDRFRYLPQKKTTFNPDALPVGFVKERYQGKDYVGYTCAACHTGQINFGQRALRIDGGPAMADMVGFLTEMTQAMVQTLRTSDQENTRFKRFVERVLELNINYASEAEVEQDLIKWTQVRQLYNTVNHSTFSCNSAIRVTEKTDEDKRFCQTQSAAGGQSARVDYGYARLDAFGRIYNRVLQYAINPRQVRTLLRSVTIVRAGAVERLLSDDEVDRVLDGVVTDDDIILDDNQLTAILANLTSTQPGYPALSRTDLLRVRNTMFNSPNAPVSYPFLWDITHSDYVQWNSIASNAELGPLGRNAGEVMGVFGVLDWHRETGLSGWFKRFSLAGFISGQSTKKEIVNYKSSIDLFNLQRLERKLITLVSPRWPFCKRSETGEHYLPEGNTEVPVDERACRDGDEKIDTEMKNRGQLLYAKHCERCHQVIDRTAADRLMIGKLVGIDHPESTDKAMASNSVFYQGKSGNLEGTYQKSSVGNLVMPEDAPVAMILTATTSGVVATPDADKWWPRRMAEWLYSLVMTLKENPVKQSEKVGEYAADTTAQPFNSLLAYRARSLNGIWATAPYLHNGSVPSLYDLLLPATAGENCPETRPKQFVVGAREFDPDRVGFISAGYDGFIFDTSIRGNFNTGHEYGACDMSEQDRWDLVEFMKSL
ncbi:di-heme-cytochrome C peroxidase [Aestuariirhabdus sp. Z084]|uniref:di-heme-cytochrome C peroxidase n=1 Tax=Aestuariirhabdus haliotis TaxID=2918751 RepID=UPI00201B3E15|nr:di-heme-cytochrome C peroxidase [Aestuariirhabdus haliotis]MCL6415079.1 di-heme-cytochrome C peroxidase [Aestuariirhabdus haliotis]MCL6419011.1 di-heme-cytochrome C peroxidase [Aestuariirhabdus haliotis]